MMMFLHFLLTISITHVLRNVFNRQLNQSELHVAQEGKGDVKPAVTPSSAQCSSVVVAALSVCRVPTEVGE